MGQANVVEKRFVATRMDTMRRKKLEWLWPERIALGTLTVLAGDFESGKSLLAADLAARVSRGDAWQDGRPGLGPSQVLMLSHEGDLQDALEAAGADMTRIVSLEETEELGRCGCGRNSDDEGRIEGVDGLARFAPHPRPLSPEYRCEGSQDGNIKDAEELEVVKRRPINLQIDLDALEAQLAGMENCRLVIIDPIDAHLTGGNSVAARMWLRSLMVIAAKYQVAMVLVTGLKEGKKSPLYRLMGGMGLAGAVRGVWVVEREPKELSVVGCQLSVGQKRLLLTVKNNLSGQRTGLAFRLVVDVGQCVPRVEWSAEAVTETVEEVMEKLRQKSAKPSPAVSRAMEFLQETLAYGPKLMLEVLAEAKEREGISRASLERARKEMGVRAFRKEVPGPWWVCSKEDEAGKTELSCAVDGVECVDRVGNEAVGRNAESAEDAETRGGEDAEMVEVVGGVEGLNDGLGNDAGEGTTESTEATEMMRGEGCSVGVDGLEHVDGVGGVDGVGRGTDSKRERIRQRKLKLKRMKKERQRQRKMQRAK